ncbi:MAG TPA: S9 family peptidase [Thermoanaerobaculia bacterium]|nr:S9 family peptidase [Thermoanaerobaculia bacterium]
MSHGSWIAAAAALVLIAACRTVSPSGGGASAPPRPVDLAAPAPEPPLARRIPHELEAHGRTRVDDYYWLRERENSEVIAYLEAENAYTEGMMRHTASTREAIFDEIVARIPQADESVPVFENGWYWVRRWEPGKEYPIYTRRKTLESPEQIVLDVNAMAKGHNFYSVAGMQPSDSGEIVAWALDTVGRRKYDLHFKDLRSERMLPEVIEDVTPNTAWAADGRTIFYTRQDPETLRWFQIWRHEIGTDPATDALVFEETDEEFNVHVYRSKSKRYVMIASSQTMEDEVRWLDASSPRSEPRVLEPRKRGREYSADHIDGFFYIRTNDGGRNFRIVRSPEHAPGYENWVEVVAHSDEVFIDRFELFRDHLVLAERTNALTRIHVVPWSGAGEHFVAFDEPVYVVRIDENPEPDTAVVRLVYSSLTTPASTWDYDMATRERVLRKRERVGGGYDPADYVTERIWAPTRDGRSVPISLVSRKGAEKNGTAPLLLYGYGSYGYSVEPAFNSPVISLLDRGFVYAIAHVRGGQELGRAWYDEGKLLRKKNTFTDFIEAAELLVEQGYADRDRVFASGGSAGGLLVGAVMTMRPDLWKGIVARVPFVDIVTTMLDESIPLTTSEYDEWGNPNEKEYHDYMLSYSPYDQTTKASYPNLLVTTGLHDSQVQYWEPAKWVAKLRRMSRGDARILLHTQMEAGHGGMTGRFRRHHETALAWAFLVDLSRQ